MKSRTPASGHRTEQIEDGAFNTGTEEVALNVTTIGLDFAKNIPNVQDVSQAREARQVSRSPNLRLQVLFRMLEDRV